MAKFADTPAWKRKMVWDPKRRKLVEPATDNQLLLIYKLMQEQGLEPYEPLGKREATELIRKLIAKDRARAVSR